MVTIIFGLKVAINFKTSFLRERERERERETERERERDRERETERERASMNRNVPFAPPYLFE